MHALAIPSDPLSSGIFPWLRSKGKQAMQKEPTLLLEIDFFVFLETGDWVLQVKLSQQALFKSRPAEGNTSIVFSKAWGLNLGWNNAPEHARTFLGLFSFWLPHPRTTI